MVAMSPLIFPDEKADALEQRRAGQSFGLKQDFDGRDRRGGEPNERGPAHHGRVGFGRENENRARTRDVIA